MIELNGVRAALGELTPAPPRFFRAPGRVTLIGEHVDYTEGFVLPLAIDRATVAAAASRPDRLVRVRSVERAETAEFSLDGPPERSGAWIDYIHGTALALLRRGVALSGADIAVRTSIPLRAGLSSSAALQVATAIALLELAGERLPPADIARAAREAENDFIGAHSGIVDQLTSTLGQRDHVLLIDCRSEETSAIPLALEGTAIVVCDSHVQSDRAAAAHNERREQCVEAAALLRVVLPKVKTLRDVSLADFLRTAEKLPPLLRRRTRHVVTENVRVLQTVAAVRAADPAAIGARMNESHESLRDDFEVSAPELDFLVATAHGLEGVYGSRMTGGGFGGSTVSLLRRDALPAFRAAMASAYRCAFGREPAILEVRASDGAAPIL
ncbi:MAG: galactokinase [Candidatus Velthaea sp.]